MLTLAIIAIFAAILLLARSIGETLFAVQQVDQHVVTARADMLAELEFVRSQLADYIGNELLEKRVLPAVGYRETTDPVKQLIGAAVAKEFFTK